MLLLAFLQDVVLSTIALLLESSVWLLFGLLFAGALRSLSLGENLQREIAKPGAKSVLFASIAGIPLPLCSCSVIPVGSALREKGASPGATASFFIATPQIGIDSFFLTFGLLGAPFAFARILVSFFTAFCAGLLIDWQHARTQDNTESKLQSSCCSSGGQERGAGTYVREFYESVFAVLIDLRLYLLIGYLLAGVISSLLPEQAALPGLGSVAGAYLGSILIALPAYVCATASTPFAAVLLSKGISTGAVLFFLMLGPATNIATVVALKKVLGLRGTLLYLFGIIVVALLGCLLIDVFVLIPPDSIPLETEAGHVHAHPGVLAVASSLLLLLMLLWSYRKTYGAKRRESQMSAGSCCGS